MQPLSSSDDDGGDLFSTREKKIGTRRSMRSLFASDDMQSRHGVTSLRYEDQTRLDKAVSMSIATPVPGAPPNAPSPLQTAAQGVAMAYKGDTCVGPCVVALCVPHANAPPAAVALIAIVDREKRAQCRVRLDAHLQLLQNPTEPQYASLYDPALGAHWSLMFKDRRACTEFVAAVFTAQHCADAESAAAPLFAEWGHSAEPVAPAVRKGSSVTISFMSWLLRRVPNTRFFSLGKLIDEVPPEAPRDASVGVGEMMAGVEEALLGMTRETARIVFVPPRKTHVRRGMGNPEIGPSDTVVVHIMCHEVRPGGETISTPISAAQTMRLVAVDKAEAAPRREDTHRTPNPQPTQNALSADPNSLLQAILLQTLQQQQQQQQQQQNGGSGNGSSGGSSMETVERSLDRVQMQLSSLYEKIDRLSIDEKLEKNNASIERIVKRAVGKAPVCDIDVEDAAKDRDALLASIERLKSRLDEANNNYHRALEAMGRHKDETQQLQNDLRIQRDAHDARVRQLEETARLRSVEAEARHHSALQHCAAEQFRAGREEGLREGALNGQRDALEAAGAHTNSEWRERLFAAEQRALQVESEMHEREARHHAERRRLQEEADALRETVARLERIAAEKKTGDYDAPDRVAQRRKQMRRALNAVYTNAEAQMSAASTENPLIHMEDALRMVFVAVKAESKVFLDEIAKEAALREAPEAVRLHEYRETVEEETVENQVENHVADGNAEDADGMAKKNEEESKIKVDELPPAPPRETPAMFFGSGDATEFPDPPILTLHGNGEEEETERDNN